MDSDRQGKRVKKTSRRKFVVFSCLISMLTLTSALLLALAPVPLTPDDGRNLYAIDAPDSLDAIFQTRSDNAKPWKYIYIHHSRSASGSAVEMIKNPGGLGD